MPSRTFHLDVREFVSFVHQRGDLGGSGHFQVAERAVLGTKGHRRLQQSRGPDYQAEIPIEYEEVRDGVILKLGGRVDGIMPLDPVLLEEIKTVDFRWDGRAHPLHMAQLKTYAAILAKQRDWNVVQLQLTYLDYETDQTTPFRETVPRAALDEFLAHTLDEWFAWLIPHVQRLEKRDASAANLDFPFVPPRSGQIELSRMFYKAIRDKTVVFSEAPTGLGKTMAAMFASVKSFPLLDDGKIFYLTAKTPGRQLAEEAADKLIDRGAAFITLNLTAKSKICFSENATGCDPRTCPYAQGYHERIKPAVRELLQESVINRQKIEAVARQHQVCPFELSLDTALWVDVIIADFNYAFDPGVRLQRFFGKGTAKHVVLVDEAHNLVERSRDMYSASIFPNALSLPTGTATGKEAGPAKRSLSAAAKAIREAVEFPQEKPALPVRAHHEKSVSVQGKPVSLLAVLQKTSLKLEKFLASQPAGQDLSGWLAPYFLLQNFLNVGDQYDDEYFTLYDSKDESIKLFCADPRKRLAETLKGFRAALFFSATLSPLDYFREVLGGDVSNKAVRFKSPFSSSQITLRVLPRNVTFKAREASLASVADDIREHLESSPGNHLIFCPSHKYLEILSRSLADRGIQTRQQASTMNEQQREEFLALFKTKEPVTALAVLGGIFAEGVDLPGEYLIGVNVIGVGLPRLSLERDLLEMHFQQTCQKGYEYAYLFPGMQRVVQAVGRLIRTDTDQGSALLIDSRFTREPYRSLLPEWWTKPTLTLPE